MHPYMSGTFSFSFTHGQMGRGLLPTCPTVWGWLLLGSPACRLCWGSLYISNPKHRAQHCLPSTHSPSWPHRKWPNDREDGATVLSGAQELNLWDRAQG